MEMWLALLLSWIQHSVGGWHQEYTFNQGVDLKDTISEVLTFSRGLGEEVESSPDFHGILHADETTMLIGARNALYNISMERLEENLRLIWPASALQMTMCQNAKSERECQNHIRVVHKISETELVVCGTNAFKPVCRKYQDYTDNLFTSFREDIGIGLSPYGPDTNSTTVVADGRLYTACTIDPTGRDAIIYSSPMKTEARDSQWLNYPNFVSSYDYGDKIYMFFREIAIEHINCGKAIYSRVARVCKNDEGGNLVLRNTWTSFFKARLNCSIPGEYPFYFDEIQSTSVIGKGNYMPTLSYDNTTDMVYAVFNTPGNSIRGSAVCAYRFSDIITSFEGPFKGQIEPQCNWLPVSRANQPEPHPGKQCYNSTKNINDATLDFIKTHPIMEQAVPTWGGQPVLVQTSFKFRLTHIAVDWQVAAGDGRYYDVLFLGTDDGRVVKAINKGRTGNPESVVIEDIQVFTDKAPVKEIRVYRHLERGVEKLIVVSQNEIKSIPLHRCHLKTSCSGCVALQDPYCSWHEGRCTVSRHGIQSVERGIHSECPVEESPEPSTDATVPVCPPCICPTAQTKDTPAATPCKETNTPPGTVSSTTTMDNRIPSISQVSGRVGESTENSGMGKHIAIAVVISGIIFFLIGLVAGYCARNYQYSRQPLNTAALDASLEKKHNTNAHNVNRTDNYVVSPTSNKAYLNTNNVDTFPTPDPGPKQLNVYYNPLKKAPNGGTETSVQQNKVKKVYL